MVTQCLLEMQSLHKPVCKSHLTTKQKRRKYKKCAFCYLIMHGMLILVVAGKVTNYISVYEIFE